MEFQVQQEELRIWMLDTSLLSKTFIMEKLGWHDVLVIRWLQIISLNVFVKKNQSFGAEEFEFKSSGFQKDVETNMSQVSNILAEKKKQ